MKSNDNARRNMTQSRVPGVCGNCAHWRKIESQSNDTAQGMCKRFPPIIVQSEDGAYSLYPQTESIDECGEFGLRADA
jgi:hypothetical protein